MGQHERGIALVFSAHAEVVPLVLLPKFLMSCILRARGGSSKAGFQTQIMIAYSPRTRR